MSFGQACIASGGVIFAALGLAPFVLGTWVLVQQTRGILVAVWIACLLVALAGALAVGALGIFALVSVPLGG